MNPIILGIRKQLLGSIGTALLHVKNARGLRLDDMAEVMGRSDEAIAQYIAGEAEMGVSAWMRAIDAWPELSDRLTETSAERALRAKQRPLDLELPTKREVRAA